MGQKPSQACLLRAELLQIASFLQPAYMEQDSSVTRAAFEGRETEDNGLPVLQGFLWGRGGLILMTCIREEEVWFL